MNRRSRAAANPRRGVLWWREDQPDLSPPSLADHRRGLPAGANRDETTRLPDGWKSHRPLPERSPLHNDLASRSVFEVGSLGLVEGSALPGR